MSRGRPKSKITYDTLKIPKGLTRKIDEIIEKDDSFTSRADVVKDAIREKHLQVMNQ